MSLEKKQEMWKNYSVDGMTMAEIGKKYNLSRQRVHQCLDLVIDKDSKRAAYKARVDANRKPAKERVLVACCVCGVESYSMRVTARHPLCSAHNHPSVRGGLMRLVSADRWSQQRESVNRWKERTDAATGKQKPEKVGFSSAAGRRWLNKGSKTYLEVKRGVIENWPIVDVLPQEIYAQIKNNLDAEAN